MQSTPSSTRYEMSIASALFSIVGTTLNRRSTSATTIFIYKNVISFPRQTFGL